jgi:hypothetical protein
MNARSAAWFASRVNLVVTLIATCLLLPVAALAQMGNSQVDEYGSHRVTHFLHNHNLPLVGAQVVDTPDGNQELHLFGYVATPFGVQDAQQKAVKYLGDKTIKVVNSIQVNPSLKSMAASAPPPSDNPPPPDNMGIPNYVNNPGTTPNPSYVPPPSYPTTPSYPAPSYPAADSGTPPGAGNTGNSNSQWDKAMGNILKNGAQPVPQPDGPQQ